MEVGNTALTTQLLPSAILFALRRFGTLLILEPEKKPIQIPLVDFEPVLPMISHMQFLRIDIQLDRLVKVYERTVQRKTDQIFRIGRIFKNGGVDAVRMGRHVDLVPFRFRLALRPTTEPDDVIQDFANNLRFAIRRA